MKYHTKRSKNHSSETLISMIPFQRKKRQSKKRIRSTILSSKKFWKKSLWSQIMKKNTLSSSKIIKWHWNVWRRRKWRTKRRKYNFKTIWAPCTEARSPGSTTLIWNRNCLGLRNWWKNSRRLWKQKGSSMEKCSKPIITSSKMILAVVWRA